jgi:hypothetical protein
MFAISWGENERASGKYCGDVQKRSLSLLSNVLVFVKTCFLVLTTKRNLSLSLSEMTLVICIRESLVFSL